MPHEIETGPEALEQDLANAVRESLPLIRQLAGKPKRIPGDEQYHAIARRLVEHLQRSGVEKVVRRVNRSHSWPRRRSVTIPAERRSGHAHAFPAINGRIYIRGHRDNARE